MAWHGEPVGFHAMPSALPEPMLDSGPVTNEPPDNRITLRQSWLNELAMCPERARQSMLGISVDTDSTSTVLGSAVHYGIEQCLDQQINTGDPLSMGDTISASMDYWAQHEINIVRWNHKPGEPEKIVQLNTEAWWEQVRPTIHPLQVEYTFELPLVTDHEPEIWLRGTIDCVQQAPSPIVDWKNPGRKPSAEWEKKRWSVQAAAYTWAMQTEIHGDNEPRGFEFVYLVKGDVYRTLVDVGPAEWASLVALARSAGTLISADLPVWPLNMAGWHCSPKWCGSWGSCRGRFAGPDPWNQLEKG